MERVRFTNSSWQRRRYAQRAGRGLVEDMPGDGQDKDKNLLLIAALDHAWHWHELRITCGLQILNFYLLAIAVLITAYVSALNARDHTVSIAVALAAAGGDRFDLYGRCGQDRVARMALIPIQEVEERMAARLEIDYSDRLISTSYTEIVSRK